MISPSGHRLRSRVTVLAQYSLIAALVVAATLGPASASDYKCNRVLDGDTIHIVANNSEITLRLFAIDAPETSKTKHDPGQPFSQAASKHLAGLVLNRTVHFKNCGTDRYGRTLAVVFVDGKRREHRPCESRPCRGLPRIFRHRAADGSLPGSGEGSTRGRPGHVGLEGKLHQSQRMA